ncbi:acetolactate synthase large subunit [Pseudooceanicola aestuarii]|uniref:acetolactate synthase large subunit n=1 Tax=Pseudooceanicola aestuarii TaxID=2697319 RepID=UPI0019538DD0|nr:acetolactate synthase large subunit [Pseudooceanicola aestuarii]
MNGADKVVEALADEGIDLCLTNPGTSEMHFLAALDARPDIRPVLALQENIATGAADGFFRIAGRPASTLLHLGPGLSNGLANLHNAHRAMSAVVNIIGDHATHHRKLDAPLTSDIEGLAAHLSASVRTVQPGHGAKAETRAAVAEAAAGRPGIASLLLPGDSAWDDAGDADREGTPAAPHPRAPAPDEATLRACAEALQQDNAVLFLGFGSVRGEALEIAGRIAAKTGARIMGQTSNPVTDRGAGRVRIERLPFAIDQAIQVLSDVEHMVLATSKAPVAFFAHPGKPGVLTPEGCEIHELAPPHGDATEALAALAAILDAAEAEPQRNAAHIPDIPEGRIDAHAIGCVLAKAMPENAIFVDESITNSFPITAATMGAAPHRQLHNLGGSIGYSLPVAIGCSLAEPDAQVITICGDGSAMYTIQALWTQARENLNIVTIILANRSYRILQGEVERLEKTNRGKAITDMLDIGRPNIGFAEMAESMGVTGIRVEDVAGFALALEEALDRDGPSLIEAVLD